MDGPALSDPPHSPAAAHGHAALALPRCHVRAPSTALTLETDLAAFAPRPVAAMEGPTAAADTTTTPTATAAMAGQDGFLRSAWSATSLGSLSPASARSSPASFALGDLTPLPSPLAVADSPGPWPRAAYSPLVVAAAAAAATAMASPSPTPAPLSKGYSSLVPQPRHGAGHTRNRSRSEHIPDVAHPTRPRNATMGSAARPPPSAPVHHIRRETCLATSRGIRPAPLPAGLPTPPASNTSNRSVTDTEDEDPPDDSGTQYIAVRHGPHKVRQRWRPVRLLGQGTFSKVYLATCEKTAAKDPLEESLLDPRSLVAIKVVEHGPAGGADEERVELSLKREVEMLRSVSHPSLVRLQAFDCDDAQALLVLTYCPGGDLFEVANDHRDKLTLGIVQRIFAEIVSAVRHLHTQLIVHRDIKLENILLNIPVTALSSLSDPSSHPYALATLTDLGLSRRIPAPPASPLLTTRCGSEDYAAPEILLGQPYDGRATDAWALGVLLYALMEGRLPFDPPPGTPASRSRPAHRIARCDWAWVRFGDADGEWDAEKGVGWTGARAVVDALLRKVSRGRKGLEEIEAMDWVQAGLRVEGGLRVQEGAGSGAGVGGGGGGGGGVGGC